MSDNLCPQPPASSLFHIKSFARIAYCLSTCMAPRSIHRRVFRTRTLADFEIENNVANADVVAPVRLPIDLLE